MARKSKFVCVKRRRQTGINWCVESRRYELRRKWWQRFSKIHTTFIIEPGNFYFSEDRKLLPQEGTKENGSGLGPFLGKEYIDWALENTKGRVRLYCKRDSDLDFDKCGISLGFSDANDIMLFKLWRKC